MKSVREIFRAHAVFNEHGVHVNGTDKQSNHNYGDAYERIIADYLGNREAIKLAMEVGVADGSSLLAWGEVFPNATIVGLDIHPAARAENRGNIEFHLGSQSSLEDCLRAVAGRQFDFICEDATHQLENTLQTLLYLWPSVKRGGLYVVEEFADIGALLGHVKALWPNSEVVPTVGPSGGIEPLVVLRKR